MDAIIKSHKVTKAGLLSPQNVKELSDVQKDLLPENKT